MPPEVGVTVSWMTERMREKKGKDRMREVGLRVRDMRRVLSDLAAVKVVHDWSAPSLGDNRRQYIGRAVLH